MALDLGQGHRRDSDLDGEDLDSVWNAHSRPEFDLPTSQSVRGR